MLTPYPGSYVLRGVVPASFVYDMVQVVERAPIGSQDLPGEPNWHPGRRQTGYHKMDLRIHRVMGDQDLNWLFGILYGVSGADRSKEVAWDHWLLRYPEGSLVPPHVDESPAPGTEVWRMNVLIQAAQEGGHFYLNYHPQHMRAGDVVVFRPDLLEHNVCSGVGERVVLSLGVAVRSEAGEQLDKSAGPL